MATVTVGKASENRLRRRAARLGLALRKTRASGGNRGVYGLVEPARDRIVVGQCLGFSLVEVGRYLDEVEAERAEARSREDAEGRFGRHTPSAN